MTVTPAIIERRYVDGSLVPDFRNSDHEKKVSNPESKGQSKPQTEAEVLTRVYAYRRKNALDDGKRD